MVFAGTPVAWASWPSVCVCAMTLPPFSVDTSKGTSSTHWKVKGKICRGRHFLENVWEKDSYCSLVWGSTLSLRRRATNSDPQGKPVTIACPPAQHHPCSREGMGDGAQF